jgi:hypothetical protein
MEFGFMTLKKSTMLMKLICLCVIVVGVTLYCDVYDTTPFIQLVEFEIPKVSINTKFFHGLCIYKYCLHKHFNSSCWIFIL